MGHYEDLWWEIDQEMKKNGLRKEFDAQLAKMNNQAKHKFKDTRDRWTYAREKVIELHKKNQSIN
tara:strand:- start:1031 stop:1225 length:195 start_codon:yes stop_codon:yes gene_type:complete